VTLSVTGDAGKVMALQLKLAKFGIVELVRTGKIALKRGRQLLEMGGWGDSALRRRQQQRQKQVNISCTCSCSCRQ
jgi:Small subunit of acetolactate synthase